MAEETPDAPSDEAEWKATMKEAREKMWTPVKEESQEDIPNTAATERVCVYMCACALL